MGVPSPPGPPRTIFSQKINGKQKNVVFWYRWRFLRAYLNSAGSVDSMGVLVPRECVRMERSEDVTHPEKIHFEGHVYADACVLHEKWGKYLEQGIVSNTPPHCQILKLISRFSPEI